MPVGLLRDRRSRHRAARRTPVGAAHLQAPRQHPPSRVRRGAEDRCPGLSQRSLLAPPPPVAELGRGRAPRLPAPHPLRERRPRHLSRADQPLRQRRGRARRSAGAVAARRLQARDPAVLARGGRSRARARAARRAPSCCSRPSRGYPAPLAALDAPPPLLYVKGAWRLLNRPTIAIVGSRQCSAAGAKLARHFAIEIGRAGYVVASGLARGIDGMAHEAALDTGTDRGARRRHRHCLPARAREPAAAIGERGCLVTEMPVGFVPRGKDFPAPQPHRLGRVAGRAHRRGGAPLGHAWSPRGLPPSRAARCSPCRAIRSTRARRAPTSF